MLIISLFISYYLYKGGSGFIVAALFPVLVSVGLVLQVVSFFKVKNVNLNVASRPQAAQNIPLLSDEKITGYISGILRIFSGGFAVRSTSFLDVGRIKQSENAALITNKRIIFVTVPLAGSETVLGGFDFGMSNWALFSQSIRAKLEEMLNQNKIGELLISSENNFSVNLVDIQEIKFRGMFDGNTLRIKTKTGQKYFYAIRDKAEHQKAVNMLSTINIQENATKPS